MIDINEATLVGNIGRDPEVSEFGDGEKRVSFSLATSRRWRDGQGNRVERTEWHNIVVFAPFAEAAIRYARKGEKAMVRGRIESREWTGDDGVVRRSFQITVAGGGAFLNFLGPRARPAAADEEAAAASAGNGEGGADAGGESAPEAQPGELAV